MALRSPQHQQAGRAGAGAGARNSNSDKKSNNIMLQKYLIDCRSFYSCLYCRTHLANHDELISRSFQGNRSRAYLFNSVINITTGQPVQRELNTGSHAVADIFCSNCATTIGWKYEKAYVDSQKYKEGKFIIELAHVVRENRHLELDKRDMFLRGLQATTQPATACAQSNGTAAEAKCSTVCRPNDLGGGRMMRPETTTSATIGQLQRGSLSPPSSTSTSSGSDSSGGSSSSSSAWSPSSSNCLSSSNGSSGPRMASARMIQPATSGDSSEDDEEDVLMFPFHDDLYGERASYSNLSLLRLGQRARRSLHLDSAPYDWKYSTSSSRTARSSTCSDVEQVERPPTSQHQMSPVASSLPQSLTAPGSSGARQRASNSTSSEETHDDDDGDDGEAHENDLLLLDEIQFKLDPCNSASAAVASRATANQQNCDQSAGRSGGGGGGGPSTTPPSPSRADSMSLDDEEFYDCCTEHLVANAPANAL